MEPGATPQRGKVDKLYCLCNTDGDVQVQAKLRGDFVWADVVFEALDVDDGFLDCMLLECSPTPSGNGISRASGLRNIVILT